jgi:transcriptional regulator with XRE-family HTH domain
MKSDPEHLLEEVGRRIAELRERAGLTQAQVAERFGTTVSNYQRIEHGFQNMTVLTLAKIARILDVELNAFFARPRRPRSGRGRPRKRRE